MMQVPSLLAVARWVPSGLQATPVTGAVWPVRVWILYQVLGFQMMQVSS